ncbi:MAG: RNA methyltransferase [Bacteroidetes bacterium]|nr:RNA methyltransferase [Bacteroidia bacterium]MBL4715368.1 RNA methyltransferase [Bacteroidia bacterium]PCH67529.1 MAG: RNA methyltransferase [Bacteroidota bacterium]
MTPEREAKLRKVVKNRQLDLTVVMEHVDDPHNISAVLRTCDAIGIHEVQIIDKSEPEEIKMGKRSAASALKWVELNYFQDADSCIERLKSNGFQIYSTHLSSKSSSLFDLDLTQRIALVFGNEKEGVSEEMLKMSDKNFNIPQVGMIQSLNISVACAVTLYEAFRQRNGSHQVGEDNFDELFELYTNK